MIQMTNYYRNGPDCHRVRRLSRSGENEGRDPDLARVDPRAQGSNPESSLFAAA